MNEVIWKRSRYAADERMRPARLVLWRQNRR
jgi:hypothetical protein